jgi:flagellar hook-associated protein 2
MVSTGGLAPTGTFDVDISQAATRAGMLGAVFGGVYTSVSGSDQIAIRDISTGYLATATITPGMTLADIVSAINTSASNPVSEVRQGREYLVGAVAATGVSTLDLLNVGGSPLGITDGDSLRISGTRGDGSSYSTTFLVTDAATQTLEQLRSAAQAAIGSSATVGITDGRLTVTTLTGGASTTLQITSDNLGGGTFGQDDGVVVTIGRPPVPVFAQITGGALELVQLNYGASQGLRVEFTDEAGDGFEQLGFTANQTAMGLDVVGTIGGFSATGFGQTLTGDAGTGVAGLVMRYTGNTTGLIGSVGVSVGLGALLERATETMLLSNVGTLDVTSAGYDARMASLDGRIAFLEAGLERREANLVRRFARLEESLLRLQQAGLALGSFIDAQNQANSR